MTIFSDAYEKLAAGRPVKVYDAAQACHISPASLYQIFSGKRKPPSRQMVSDLSNYLQFPPLLHQELLDAYKKTVIGEEAFERRLRVENFLKSGNRLTAPVKSRLAMQISLEPDVGHVVLMNTMQVTCAFFCLMDYAANSGEELCLRVDANCPIIGDIAGYFTEKPLRMRQIFAVDGQPDSQLQTDSLFDILEKSILMYTSHSDYDAYTIYANSGTDISVFPYYAVTPGMVLFASEDFSTGYIAADRELSQIVLDAFQKSFDLATLFMEPIPNAQELIRFYQDNLQYFNENAHLFHTRFCPTFYMDRSLILKYLNDDYFPSVEMKMAVANMFDAYSTALQNQMATGIMPSFYISSDAIARFLKEGALEDYPAGIANPVEPEDRILLVRRMIESLDIMDYRALKPGAGPETSNIEIWSCVLKGTLTYRSVKGEDFCFAIHHDYLLRLLQEYFDTLDPELFYTRDEFQRRIRRDLDRYEKSLNEQKRAQAK